jgi:hypothetical protein
MRARIFKKPNSNIMRITNEFFCHSLFYYLLLIMFVLVFIDMVLCLISMDYLWMESNQKLFLDYEMRPFCILAQIFL